MTKISLTCRLACSMHMFVFHLGSIDHINLIWFNGDPLMKTNLYMMQDLSNLCTIYL